MRKLRVVGSWFAESGAGGSRHGLPTICEFHLQTGPRNSFFPDLGASVGGGTGLGNPHEPDAQVSELREYVFSREIVTRRASFVVRHIFMLPLPSGLSRRERQLAGYTRTLRNTFPEHSWLSVGPVPAGARLAG